MIIRYIDAYKASYGVEPICRVLKAHDYAIAPSTYYAFKRRPTSARSRSDARLLEVIKSVHRDNFDCYGVRKVWHELQQLGHAVGRDQVARLMRSAGLRGVSRRRGLRTTRRASGATPAPDLVQRKWSRDAPDIVWVSDFTYVPTRYGWVFTSFLQDAFSRFILAFTVSASMNTQLVLRNIEQAVSVRRRMNAAFSAEGVICHADHGSQFTSLAFTRKLIEHGIDASMGHVGSAYDCQSVRVGSW